MNKIILLGRLTRDPEIRYTQTGACVAQFTLAVDRPYTKDGSREADFISCVTWGKTSETIGNYVHKGQRLLVEGRLQIRSYDAKDGSKRWVTEVIVSQYRRAWKVSASRCLLTKRFRFRGCATWKLAQVKFACGAIKKRLYRAFSTTVDQFTVKNASVSC